MNQKINNPNPEKYLSPGGPLSPEAPENRAFSRRSFLSLLGVGLVLGGAAAYEYSPFKAALAVGRATSRREFINPSPGPVNDHKLIMIINLANLSPEMAWNAQRACQLAHNIPLDKPDLSWFKLKSAADTFPPQVKAGYELTPNFCNHCDNPLCVLVCPTGATFKRANGLVAQDPHRCLGCRFCQKVCPFGARSFNETPAKAALTNQNINYSVPAWGRGVVAKCNFCENRLEGPACLEAASEAFEFGFFNNLETKTKAALSPTAGLAAERINLGPNVFYRI